MTKSKTISLFALFALTSQIALGAKPSWDQRKELWLSGEITDKNTNKTWNVIIVPGAHKIDQDALHGWQDAEKAIAAMAHKPFWVKRKKDVKDGLVFSKDVIKDQWWKGIGHDFTRTKSDNEKVVPGEIGSFFFPLVNWVWFGVKSVSRTVWMPVGTVGGVTYSITKPVLSVLAKPVAQAGAYDALGRGLVVPAVLYVWNGVTWVGLSVGNVPTKESPFVRIVHEKTELVIDKDGFDAIVHAAVLKHMTEAERAKLQAEITRIETEARAKEQPLRDGQTAAQQKLDQSPAQKLVSEISAKAMSSTTVSLSTEAKEIYLDESKLKGFITEYLKGAGVENPSEELVAAITKMVGDNLLSLNVKMGEKASAEAAK